MGTKDKARFHIVLVQGIIEKEGKYLIAQRSFTEVQSAGLWSLPGGKVEIKKNDLNNIFENTLKKEIKEEVDVNIKKRLVYLQSWSFVRIDGASVVGSLFLCRWLSGIAKPCEDSINVRWIYPDELPHYQVAGGVESAFQAVNEYYTKQGR
jgi:8-oxo-dGTP diphosphatase